MTTARLMRNQQSTGMGNLRTVILVAHLALVRRRAAGGAPLGPGCGRRAGIPGNSRTQRGAKVARHSRALLRLTTAPGGLEVRR